MKKYLLIVSILLFGWTMAIQAGSKDVIKIGLNETIIQKEPIGNVVAIGCDLKLNQKVEGNIFAVGGEIELGPKSIVEGKIISVGAEIIKKPGALVKQPEKKIKMDSITCATPGVKKGKCKFPFIFKLLSFLGLLALAAVLVAMFPKHFQQVSLIVNKHPWKSTGAGFLGLIAIVPIMILLAISIVGIFLIPVEFIFVFCAMFMGYLAVANLIGERFLDLIKAKLNRTVLINTLCGVVLLSLINLLPIIGGMLNFIVALVGFGGVLRSLYLYKKKQA
jgi:hypothetical protein